MRYVQAGCVLLILIVGMLLRLGTATGTEVDHPIRNDAKAYVAYAWNSKYLGVYSPNISTVLGTSTVPPKPDASSPPGYPMLLRVFMPFELDVSFITKVTNVQVWIAGITLLCSTLLAMALLGVWPGLALGALVALSPHQSVYVPYLLTETSFGAALMLALAAGSAALTVNGSRKRAALAFCSGILFGLTCLIRPTLNQWVPVLLVLLLIPVMRRLWREAAVLALGFALMMSPWWIRNEITLHRMGDSEKMLVTIQQGSYVNLMYQERPETFGAAYDFDPGARRATSSWQNLIDDLHDKIVSRPVDMLRWYLFGKVTHFFSWTSAEGWGDIFTYPVLRSPWLNDRVYVVIASLMRGLHAPLMIFGLLGTLVVFLPRTKFFFGRQRSDALRFIALLHLFAVGVHVIGLPLGRYSVPFRPVSFILAIFLVVWLYRLYQEQRLRDQPDAASYV